MRKGVERWTATSTVVIGVVVLAVALYTKAGEARATPAPAQRGAVPSALVDFEKQIMPILEANCLECHSADKRKGGLSLAVYTDVLDGGRSGAVVRPGQAANSLLLARVRGELGDQMPLDTLPLGAGEIATLGQWIDQGARRTPTSPPAPAPWEAPLALTAPRSTGGGVGTVGPSSRPVRRRVSLEGQGSRATTHRRQRVRASRVSRHLGASAFSRRDPGFCRRPGP